jgi:hypothetical protein
MKTTMPAMKAIPSLVAFLLIVCPLHAQDTGQPAEPRPPGAAPDYGMGGGSYGTATEPGRMSSAGNPFAAGLLSEEAEQDLGSAAASYRRTIQAFDRQRTEAANAIFRLGEVYRKMGRLEEAKVQYARILREFPDMVRLTELSHGLLLGEEGRPGMGGPEARTTAVDPATEARTSSDQMIMELMRERYGLGAGSQRRPDRYSPATGPSMDPAMAARYGIGLPSPSRAPTESRAGSTTPTEGAEHVVQQGQSLSATIEAYNAELKDRGRACISNLKQLGLAARIYAAEEQSVYPASPALMSNEIAVPKVLVCPSDTARQAAPSWAEFDPVNHMTYEYLGAGFGENEPQRPLYRCPIHGHVALGDGSVHHGRTPSPGALEQAQDELEQRVLRFGEEAAQRAAAILNTILNNLRQIDGAKAQWALENRQPAGAHATEQDIAGHIRGGFPAPIAGERYEIKAVGEWPEAVLTRPVGTFQAGARLTTAPSGFATDATEPARNPAVVRIPVVVSSDGTIRVEGKPVEMDMLRARLHERTADRGRDQQLTMVIVQADQEADFVRVAEVLEACRSAGVTNVTVATGLRPGIHQEIERLTAERDALQHQTRDHILVRGRLQESVRAGQRIAEARTQQELARQRLDALAYPADRLPAIVSQDPRYQRLKAEYETAVLDGDEAAEKAARTRLQDWVEKIYRPELESEVQLADGQRDQWERTAAELEMLSARRREQEQQLGLLQSQVAQLRKLLELPEPSPGTE